MSELRGWLPADVAEAMQEMIRDRRPTLCVEVGVFGGQSLVCIAEALRLNLHGKVWGIDPWSNDAANEGFPPGIMDSWGATQALGLRFVEVMTAITDRQLWEYVRILPTRSGEVAALFPTESIDFLHLDGNHSEQGFTADVVEYVYRALKPGGVVWVDDVGYAREFQGMRIVEGVCDHVQDYERYRLYQRRAGGGHIGR